MKAKIILFFFTVSCTVRAGEISFVDSGSLEKCNDTTIRYQSLILPASLIALGTWGICNGWIQQINHSVNDEMERLRGDCRFHLDDYIQYLPVASHVGLGLVGVKCRCGILDRVTVAATAYLAMGIMVNVTKFAVNERRPDTGALNSFPSGHTATAFMGAELVRLEYGAVLGWSAYLTAGGVAFLRLYNDRHWVNDIIAGAGIGILSARIGYWLLPFNRRLLGLSEIKCDVTVMPVYTPQNHNFGFALTASF